MTYNNNNCCGEYTDIRVCITTVVSRLLRHATGKGVYSMNMFANVAVIIVKAPVITCVHVTTEKATFNGSAVW